MKSEQLKQIAHEINTQDNRITADPMFIVFERIRVYGIDPLYSYDGFDWVNYDSDADDYDACDSDEMTDEEAKEKGFTEVYWVEQDRFCNAHFTEKSANHFIKINRHNLTRPYTYVTSLWRCYEMIDIRNFLKNSGEAAEEQE